MKSNKKALIISIIVYSLVSLSMIGLVVYMFFPREHVHKEKIIPSVEPTQNSSGYTMGKKCSLCEEILLAPSEYSLLSIDVDENSSYPAVLSFELTFDKLEGEYTIYFADKEKKELPYFNQLDKVSVSANNSTVEYVDVIVPNGCEYIIAKGAGEYTFFAKIPEEYLISEDIEYKYGALSDVHFNNGNYLDGALDFLDTQNVDFVGISGDLTNSGELEYLELFNEVIKGREYKVYTTSGNHDQNAIINGDWLKTINTGITTDSEVISIAPNGLDFVFKPDKMDEGVFVFLCQTRWYYPSEPKDTEYTILQKEQLVWLADIFESNKENNVFLFFHTFLPSPNGTQESAVGNLRNPGGYAYDLPYSYGSADEIELRALLKKYKNVVFFSGHSHWMFELEKYNENLNASNFNGEYAYMVHIPSISEPRFIGENDEYRTGKIGEASEGWIAEVYDGYMMLIPVDFFSQTFYTKYMKIIPLS